MARRLFRLAHATGTRPDSGPVRVGKGGKRCSSQRLLLARSEVAQCATLIAPYVLPRSAANLPYELDLDYGLVHLLMSLPITH
jgi:hypothetical protein